LAVRGQAFKALGVWGTADTVPDLLKLLAAADAYNKATVVQALGQLKDERAIPPLAKLLPDAMLRREAVAALGAFGPKAEPAVLPYLNDQDLYVRIDVCRLLKDIGTRESVPALETASQDKSQLLARAAKEALDAINGRPAAGGPTP
jgi:HEAT repeat protein